MGITIRIFPDYPIEKSQYPINKKNQWVLPNSPKFLIWSSEYDMISHFSVKKKEDNSICPLQKMFAALCTCLSQCTCILKNISIDLLKKELLHVHCRANFISLSHMVCQLNLGVEISPAELKEVNQLCTACTVWSDAAIRPVRFGLFR